MPPTLVLASTSRYRADLLNRLGLPFASDAPGVDETALAGEPPRALVTRLARAKAEAVAVRQPEAWVIGSDQVAVRDGEVLGKPLDAPRCEAQLLASSSRPVEFLTAVCLTRRASATRLEYVDRTLVEFRALTVAEVRRYIELERPFDCAGGFKCEGLGIALFTRIETSDPTALVGLPLIWVAGALRQVGLDALGAGP